MSAGWIYLRKDASAYYIGKTSSPDSRDYAYKKENAAITTIDSYKVDDMDDVERQLIDALAAYKFFPEDKRRNETFRLDLRVPAIYFVIKAKHVFVIKAKHVFTGSFRYFIRGIPKFCEERVVYSNDAMKVSQGRYVAVTEVKAINKDLK